MDKGQWTADSGQRTVDSGQWTMDSATKKRQREQGALAPCFPAGSWTVLKVACSFSLLAVGGLAFLGLGVHPFFLVFCPGHIDWTEQVECGRTTVIVRVVAPKIVFLTVSYIVTI